MSASPSSVCILGGAGFIGRHLINALILRGQRVRVLTRSRYKHRDLWVLPQLDLVEGDVHDAEFLRQQFAGQGAVINLVGELNDSRRTGRGFQVAHVELARKVVSAARAAGVSRLLHMSALNASPEAPSRYLRSKGEAEQRVHEEAGPALAVTSFRPSVVFGPGDGFFNRFAGLLTLSPLVMPLPGAKARFAPVYVGDVVDTLIAALDDPAASAGQRLDLCGPQIFTLSELVRYLADLRRTPRLLLPLPGFAERMLAAVLQFVPGRPLTPDNLDSMKLDSVCAPGVPRQPTPIDAVVPFYLGGEDARSLYDRYRQIASVMRQHATEDVDVNALLRPRELPKPRV